MWTSGSSVAASELVITVTLTFALPRFWNDSMPVSPGIMYGDVSTRSSFACQTCIITSLVTLVS